jgi:protein gp37
MEDPDNSHHLFLILTKRAERMYDFLREKWQGYYPENIWTGISAEDWQTYKERLYWLMCLDTSKRFISLEPLLGQIEMRFGDWFYKDGVTPIPDLIDWVIVGGESGPNARPMHPDWVRNIRFQCKLAEIPFFFKQWGAWRPSNDDNGSIGKFRWVSTTGKTESPLGPVFDDGTKHHELMYKAGKGKAGRLLDGKEYNEFPTLKTEVS